MGMHQAAVGWGHRLSSFKNISVYSSVLSLAETEAGDLVNSSKQSIQSAPTFRSWVNFNRPKSPASFPVGY